MTGEARRVVRAYLWIQGLFFLAASVIWGVNTLFLLDAGLTLFESFLANAAWTAGMVLFEVPTGLIADTWGRRASFLLSASVLSVGTFLYVLVSWVGGGLVPFIAVSVLLGLAYTFYSGAVEAWLVDALRATGHEGDLDPVFARGGMVASGAMLVGTIAGGLLGTVDLAWPYLARTGLLVAAFAVAFAGMREHGFRPRALRLRDVRSEMGKVARASVRHGWGEPRVRLLMFVTFLQFGVGTWAFYAWQPYFLDLLGRPDAIWVAGVIASLIALAGIAGNALVGVARRLFRRRSSIILLSSVAYASALLAVGLLDAFFAVVPLFLAATVISRMAGPVRSAYLHEIIPSSERATVISFDALFGSVGSVGGQTGLGYLSQVQSIPVGFVTGGAIAFLSVPLLVRLRATAGPADRIGDAEGEPPPEPAEVSAEAPT